MTSTSTAWTAPRPALPITRATDGHALISIPVNLTDDLTIAEARALIDDLTHAIAQAVEVEALPSDITGVQWGVEWSREGIKAIEPGTGRSYGLNEHDYAVSMIKSWSDITTGILMVRDIYGLLPGPWRVATVEEQAAA